MPQLEVGQTIEMKGSGSKPYVIKNCGDGGYSCTCPAWRNQSIDPRIRTCKHIRTLRGDEAEQERIGSTQELPSRKPEGEVKEAPVLLAESWDGESNVTGWWMSEKLDGVRAYWDGKQLFSRKGNLYLAPDFFLADLPPVPLDGELWIDRKKFTVAQGIAMSQTRGEDWRRMRFVVFDAPAHGGEFEARLRFLGDLLSRSRTQLVTPLAYEQCRGLDHLRDELDRISALGGEGVMLRQPGSKYQAGRSSTLLKVKRFHTSEAVVIGHQPGEGKHKGRLGALVARLADGKEFRIGTGLSDAERGSPPPLGTVVTFKYQELTELGVPRFPSYVGVRPGGEITPLVKTPAPGPAPTSVTVTVPATPPAATTSRAFDYGTGDRAVVWEVAQAGGEVRLRFGPPRAPVSKTVTYPSPMAARAAVEEMIADKLDDGFVERGQATAAPTPAPPPAAPAAPAGGRRRFELVEGSSSKFWEVWVEGASMYTQYGRIGSKGQVTVKAYGDEAAARKAADKLVAEKVGKGYVEKM